MIAAATWSDPDRETLDQLAWRRTGLRAAVVLDIDDWTMFVIYYEDGATVYSGEGRDAVLWLDQI